jgi:D-beta-D-heptose 7-phosphate kinase / D-beta-D-heptose 1-phosphate adenosyltransferase
MNKNKEKEYILVIGDIMLDIDYNATCHRFCSEKKIPVHLVKSNEYRLGGCANVAKNVRKLGDKVYISSFIGRDTNGKIVQDLFSLEGINTTGLIEYNHPTITKNRIYVDNDLMFRYDEEDANVIITDNVYNKFIKFFNNIIDSVKLILFSDYNKGFLSKKLVRYVIEHANLKGINTYADVKPPNIDYFNNVTLLKPNRKEITKMTNMDTSTIENIKIAIKSLSDKINIKRIVTTLSEDGLLLYTEGEFTHYSDMYVTKNDIKDVIGAGDCVLSIIAQFKIDELDKACVCANHYGQMSITHQGNFCIDKDNFSMYGPFIPYSKYVSDNSIDSLTVRLLNKKVVFTNGCFDVLHKGHIYILNRAKMLGDILIVGLNSDVSIKMNKGDNRPYNKEEDRVSVLNAINCVDYIILFSEKTPEELVKRLKPDILVKGGDYDALETNRDSSKYIAGRDYTKECKTIPLLDNFSSTNTINKLSNK